jgi:hypothetical protein
MDIETLKTIKEFGYGIASLGFCFWLMKEILTHMGTSLITISENLKILSANILSLQNRIEFWNKDSETAHSFQREEHKEILDKLAKN